jgi:hypothetical protein
VFLQSVLESVSLQQMEMQGLPGLTALVELPAYACAVSIKTAFSFLLKALGGSRGQ